MEQKSLKSFKDLTVWQKAVDLTSLVYLITGKFPDSELYGLTNQMRRSAVSISSNIAEGFKRNHKKEKLQFYNVAYGSAAELESQIEVAYKLHFLNKEDYQKSNYSVIEVNKMIDGLIKSVNKGFPKPYILYSIFFFVFLYSIFYILNPLPALAATNIDSTYRYAWNDTIGWIDFYQTLNVNVTSTQLTGYATSSVGYIALDCATSPSPSCTYSYKVSNDASGNLSGWAWNDAIGWISFDSATAGSSYIYQVIVSNSTGDFSGWAWNDIVGWISFNCFDINNCATSPNHKVKTNWRSVSATGNLTSSIFDTGVSSGVAINTVMWQGNKPSGTNVKFQIASDSTSTPATWNYYGPDGSNITYYTPTDANMPVQINLAQHNNKRYFRYKIFLESNASQTLSPRVDDVIINYSP